jgi:uncharacterized membrane protein YeaQ/YmgE (transglycosylase-associated protein family)
LDRRTRRAGTKRVIDARPRQPGADILVAGLIIGALARLIKPGKQNLGILATLGLVGSIIGGLIAQLFGTGSIWELNVIGFGLAVIAAVLLVGTAEAVVGKPPSRVICSVGPSGSTGAEAAERVASGVWSGVADVADAVAGAGVVAVSSLPAQPVRMKAARVAAARRVARRMRVLTSMFHEAVGWMAEAAVLIVSGLGRG